MVSFFGLKLGGDKKKKNDKSQDQPQWKRVDHGRIQAGDISRPTMISRPGTAQSFRAKPAPRPFASPYMMGGGASSMVDLSTPRHMNRGSISSLRQNASDANPRGRWNDNGNTSRPGTSSGQRAWPDQSDGVGKSALGQFEFNTTPNPARDAAQHAGKSDSQVPPYMRPPEPPRSALGVYPAPPWSMKSASSPPTPDSNPSATTRNGPSTLRQMDNARPVPSANRPASGTSDGSNYDRDPEERESLTPSARRGSFSMDANNTDNSIFHAKDDRPGTSGGGQSRRGRPPPLQLTHEPRLEPQFRGLRSDSDARPRGDRNLPPTGLPTMPQRGPYVPPSPGPWRPPASPGLASMSSGLDTSPLQHRELDLSFQIPGRDPEPDVRNGSLAPPRSGGRAPPSQQQVPNRSPHHDAGNNWPLANDAPPPSPGFAARGRPFTPPPPRTNSPRTELPKAPSRGVFPITGGDWMLAPRAAPAPPGSSGSKDAARAPETAQVGADDFGTKFI